MSEDDITTKKTFSHYVTMIITSFEIVLLFAMFIYWIVVIGSPEDTRIKEKWGPQYLTGPYFALSFFFIVSGLLASVYAYIGTRKEKVTYIIPSIVVHVLFLFQIEAWRNLPSVYSFCGIAYGIFSVPFFTNRCVEILKIKRYTRIQKINSSHERDIELQTVNGGN